MKRRKRCRHLNVGAGVPDAATTHPLTNEFIHLAFDQNDELDFASLHFLPAARQLELGNASTCQH
jgi:hypothetical protein